MQEQDTHRAKFEAILAEIDANLARMDGRPHLGLVGVEGPPSQNCCATTSFRSAGRMSLTRRLLVEDLKHARCRKDPSV
jgi:hypothetical protein